MPRLSGGDSGLRSLPGPKVSARRRGLGSDHAPSLLPQGPNEPSICNIGIRTRYGIWLRLYGSFGPYGSKKGHGTVDDRNPAWPH